MTPQFTTKRVSQILFIGLITVCCAAILAPVQAQRPEAERVAGETALMTRAGRQATPDCRIGTGTLRCGEAVCSPT